MALQPQATPPAGGLNQARPAPVQQPPKQENLAARAAGMEQSQDESAPVEDFFTKTMRDLQTQREALNSQTNKLLESLDARKGRLFDPTLMKMAAGFLAPTKTGSFGESLGAAASAATDEAEKEFARTQQMEKLKLELAQKQYEQAQQQGIQAHMMRRLAPSAPTGPVTSMTTPTEGGVAPGQPPQAAGQAAPQAAVTRTGAPRQQPMITDKDIMEAMILDPSGKLAQQYREAAKMQQEDVIQVNNRPYSRSRQEFLPQDPNAIVEVDFGPLFGGPKKVPYSTYEQWKTIHDSGDRAKELEFFYNQNWLKRPAGAKPGQTSGEPETAEERKRKEDIAQERLKAQVSDEKEKIGRLDTNFTQSRTIINAANSVKNLATTNPLGFDLMNKPGIAAAIGRAAESSPFNLPVKELASFNLSDSDRAALQLVQRDLAELTVAFRKAGRVPGEGATTEKEGDLYAALGIMKNDSSRVVRAKAEFLELKGKYDQEVFKAWNKFSKDPSNSYRDFLGSDELDRINNAYDKRLGELQRSHSIELGKKNKTESSAAPATATPAAKPAQTSAPASIGVPPKKGTQAYNQLPEGSLYEDTDGTIRRKKKE